MSLSSAKAKLDAQGGDPVTGYISKTDHQESYDELVDDTALTGSTTAEALDVTGALTAGSLVLGTVTHTEGTGSPQSVVSAPVGSTYIDTAATTGAIKWVKASGTGNTGWVVEYGDTGSRSLTATDTPHANTTVTTLAVRRVGSFVTLSFYLNQTGAVPETKIYDALPSGFRPGLQVTSIQNRGGVLSLADTITFDARANGQLYYAISAASTFTGQVTWFTPDAWPVTLP